MIANEGSGVQVETKSCPPTCLYEPSTQSSLVSATPGTKPPGGNSRNTPIPWLLELPGAQGLEVHSVGLRVESRVFTWPHLHPSIKL